jgi:hypothetical protein
MTQIFPYWAIILFNRFRPWPKNSQDILDRENLFPKIIHQNGDSVRATTNEAISRLMGL